MRAVSIVFIVAACLSTNALAGGSSGVGAVSWKQNQSASLIDTGATLLSWFLSFTGKPDPVGPASSAIEISKSFVDGAESFSKAIPDFEPALEFSISLVTQGQPVRNRQDLNLIQRATRESLGQQHLSDFGLSRATIDQAVEAAIERRGLKAY